jgi:hypothetical protein
MPQFFVWFLCQRQNISVIRRLWCGTGVQKYPRCDRFIYFDTGFLVGDDVVVNDKLLSGCMGKAAAHASMPILTEFGEALRLIHKETTARLVTMRLAKGLTSDLSVVYLRQFDMVVGMSAAWSDTVAFGLAASYPRRSGFWLIRTRK